MKDKPKIDLQQLQISQEDQEREDNQSLKVTLIQCYRVVIMVETSSSKLHKIRLSMLKRKLRDKDMIVTEQPAQMTSKVVVLKLQVTVKVMISAVLEVMMKNL